MKIAICFSGQIRTGHVTAPNILRYIGNLLPYCDFFVHTWDTESIGTGHSHRLKIDALAPENHRSTHVSEKEKFSIFSNFYNPRVMIIEEYDCVPTKDIWGGRRLDPNTGKFHISMWDSINQANLIKEQYAIRNKIDYDITVRIRPDIVFDETKTLAEDIIQLKDTKMFLFGDHYTIFPRHGLSRIEDILWIGPTKVLNDVTKYTNFAVSTLTENQMDDPKSSGYQDWQWYSAYYIVHKLGYTFEPLNNSKMRIFYQIDIDNKVDPLNPGFGSYPSYGMV